MRTGAADGGEKPEERDLTFAGFLLFFDPPKPGVRETLVNLAKLGVTVKLITGDNHLVAAHLANEVGLDATGILTGSQLREVSDDALWHKAERTSLFVEVDPNQKERNIQGLLKMGHTVGYMGDGINDAPALHAADLGISADSAVDVAKEPADFVLLEHDLDVLRQGIEEGRSVAVPAFLPLLANQILLNNFLSDITGMAIASDDVDREWIERPHRSDIAYIRNFMILSELVSSVFDCLTFGVLLWWVQASPEEFRTGWVVESLLTHFHPSCG